MGIIQMKKAIVLKSSLLFLSALCLPFSIAQDSPQWGLPEGAKTRLGKGSIREIQYSPDGTRLAVASSIGIWLYDTATHQEIALLTRHTDWVRSVAFSPDGNTIASGSDDNAIRLWNAHTGKLQQTLTGHTEWVETLAFSPDGNTIASGSWDNTIRLWNAHTRKQQANTSTGIQAWSIAVAFSPDGRTLASGSWDQYYPAVER